MGHKIHIVSDLFESKIEKGLSKPDELIEKCKKHNCMDALDGVSLGKDDKGYFVYTHRGRSDSYKKPESITIEQIKWVETTG